MTLRRLKWITVASALVFIVLLELVRRALGPFLPLWQGRLLMSVAIFIGALFFFGALFSILERMQGRLERQNRELLALHEAALDVSADLALEKVLQKVVDQARSLVDARYGALSVIDDKHRIESFVTSGVTPEERARIGDPPVGHGLLGVVLNEGHSLRTTDIGSDPRSHGFPPSHPPMKSLLAVPILCTGPFRSNLYLTEKAEEDEFSLEDQQSLERFAATAAIAIDNAYLHQRLNDLAVAQERLRIAHEMHDGLAQVLAYVNTKAQAVKEFLRTGRTEDAGRHLDQLAAAAREVYADVRESIIGLRSVAAPGVSAVEALHEHARTWETQTGITCRVSVKGLPKLPSSTELQLLRIVQESLANVRKHSGASRVDVSVEEADGRLRLSVEDNGAGFNPAAPGRSEFPRFGLSTMRERAESMGGTLQLDSTPGQGTRVTVELPLQTSSDR
jgi:signal transduction histidine kinase